MASNPSLSWQKIHDVYYGLLPCYETLNWSIGNLYADHKIKLSTNGTLVALSSKHASYPSLIEIYAISGNKLWSIIFNSTITEHIIDYDFKNEDLYVVLSNHHVRHYRDLRGNFNEYSFIKDLIRLDDFGEGHKLTKLDHGSGNGSGSSTNSLEGEYSRTQVITNLENNQQEEIYQVLNVNVWGKFLFLTLTNRFIITDLDNYKNYEIPISNELSKKIHCLSLVSLQTNGLSLVICYDNTAISLNIDLNSSSFEVIDHGLTDGPFSMVTVSPNGQLIALLNSQVSTIFVINNQFTQVLLEYDTSNDSSLPYQIEWCGNDAIVLSLRDEIKLLGPNQASISFFYDVIEEELDFNTVLKGNGNDELSFTIPILKNEPDGLKILTTNKLEFLSRVPTANVNLYQIGSSHPSSILLASIDKLSLHSSKADANITLLRSDGLLLNAIDECLEAALYEFNPYWQKKILLAVSFGKAYCDYYNAEKYLNVLNSLKVLNQLRSSDISIFLTYREIEMIGWSTVIDMLLKRDQYLLSIKILELLNLEYLRDRVYIHWCCYKIKKEIDLEDIELFNIISKKLKSARNLSSGDEENYLSVSDISEVAYEEGRIDLCKLLINLEPSTINKIEQYLKFEELELALIKSFQSGEYDLAKLILIYLHDTLSVSQFFKILHQNEQKSITDTSSDMITGQNGDGKSSKNNLFVNGDLVERFWVESIGKSDQRMLEKYFKQEEMKIELLVQNFKLFLKTTNNNIASDVPLSENYYEEYKLKLQKLLGYSGDRKNSKYYQIEIEVLELRKKLTDTYQIDFFNYKTITEIMIKLIEMNQLKQCTRIVKDFKISQEKFWYIVIETYASIGEFERLHQFILSTSNDKHNLKSPIGFQNIVETTLAYKGTPEYISIYIDNCKDLHYSEKIQMYIQNNDLVLAANEAYYYKDIEFLQSILERANKLANDSTIQSIKSLITKLGY